MGNRTTAVYNAAGQVEATINALNQRTTFVYDSAGRQIATVDSLGNRTTTVYNAAGLVEAAIDALNHYTTFIYDAVGRPIASIDPLGNRTTTIFDAAGQAVASIDPLNQRSTIIFNAAGQVEAAIDAANRRTTFIYDGAGQQTVVIDYNGGRTTTAYNSAGQVASITKPTGDRTTFIYDSAGRQTETIDYLGNRTTTVYDAAGQAVATVNALGKRTTTVFDDAGQVIATVDQLNHRTTFTYDAAGNRTLYQDALNNKTTFVYDALNREIERIDPHGHSVTFAYDAAGFLTSTTDRLGRRRDFSYDDVGRQTGETWIAADGSTVVDRITFTYDAAGNQLTAANGAGAYTFTYDDVNRVTTVAEPFGVSLTFTWDALGRRTKVEDSFGGVTTSVYDVLGRLESRKFGGTSQTPLRIDLTYTVEGLQESFTRYSDLSGTTKVATTSFTYDAAQRLTNLHHFDGSNNNIANYTYTFDAHSRLTNINRNGTVTTYTYDDTDQVTGDGTNNFTYDAEGNRTNEGYSTGTGNQLTSDGTWNYTYDDDGNLTKKVKISDGKTWTYGYDHRNQLLQVQRRTTDGGTLELDVDFKYDAYGNRIEKTVDSDGDGNVDTTQRYTLDGWSSAKGLPIGNENWDVFADLDGDNNLDTRYLRGDIVDQLFARIAANGDAYWYLGDHLGSIRDITDNTGVVKDTLSYDAFGNIISESDANYGGRYKWTGREIDQEIELQYNRARYYDAKIGRWISQDPLGFEAGDSNLYRYVNNIPTIVSDPSGLESFVYPWQLPWSNVQTPHWSEIQKKEITSFKATVNAGATTVKSFLTLGFEDEPWELIPLRPDEKTKEYKVLFSCNRGMFEFVSGAGISKVATLPGKVGKIAFVIDASGNLVQVGKGIHEGDPLRMATGGLGLGGNLFCLKKCKGPETPLTPGAELRARYEGIFEEYMHFRNQGFKPKQAKYLMELYEDAGHHFPIPQRTARRWGLPNWLRDNPLNVLRPNGISRGRFYELHYMVDPYYSGSRFPASIGGGWRGEELGLQMYSPWTRWWHATPGPLKVTGGLVIGGGAAGGYWLLGDSDDE